MPEEDLYVGRNVARILLYHVCIVTKLIVKSSLHMFYCHNIWVRKSGPIARAIYLIALILDSQRRSDLPFDGERPNSTGCSLA